LGLLQLWENCRHKKPWNDCLSTRKMICCLSLQFLKRRSLSELVEPIRWMKFFDWVSKKTMQIFWCKHSNVKKSGEFQRKIFEEFEIKLDFWQIRFNHQSVENVELCEIFFGPFINDVTQKTIFLDPPPPSFTKFSYKNFSFVWKCHTESEPSPSLKIGRLLWTTPFLFCMKSQS